MSESAKLVSKVTSDNEKPISSDSKSTKRQGELKHAFVDPPKKLKFGISKGNKAVGTGGHFKMSVSSQKPPQEKSKLVVQPSSRSVAAAFNQEDDDESEEEMPPEAKMRMKNIGKNTPTAAGPNSFGKTKMGFVDRRNLLEKEFLNGPKEQPK